VIDNTTLQACFENTTLTSEYFFPSGGFLMNTSAAIVFELGSPLIYFQFATNGTNATVTTWDGQQLVNDQDGLMSGAFQYSPEREWIAESFPSRVEVTQLSTGGYSVGPIDYNYTGSSSIPSNFSVVRVSSPAAGIFMVFTTTGTAIRLREPFEEWVLVRSGGGGWIDPTTGLNISTSLALSSPALFSWKYSGGEVRNLQSTLYMCSSSVIQSSPCSPDISLLVGWDTLLLATPTLPLFITQENFTTFERNFTRTSFPVTISFPSTPLPVSIISPVFLTPKRVQVDCACGQSQLETNETTLNLVWWDEDEIRQVREDLIDLGDYVVAALYTKGDRRLIRARITGIGDGTLVLYNEQFNLTFTAFFSQARLISIPEVLEGYPSRDDPSYLPMICPDGQPSALISVERDVPVICNGTYNQPFMNWTCLDATNSSWTCECLDDDEQICQCGLPALSDFANLMLQTTETVVGEDCQCLIYANEDVTNTSVLQLGPSSNMSFTVNMSQTVNFITMSLSGVDCLNYDQYLTIESLNQLLFANATIVVQSAGVVTVCEVELTVVYPAYAAVNELNITIGGGLLIEWCSLGLSTLGFALTDLTLSIGNSFEFDASSNVADSSLVILNNSLTYWTPTGGELPVFIEFLSEKYVFVNGMSIIFYQSGTLSGNITIPFRIYIQGWKNGYWYTLGSVGVYVAPGGWAERSITFDTMESFLRFRLVCLEGPFAVRNWRIVTNQYCECANGEVLTLRLGSTVGLPTVETILDQINAIDANLMGAGCVCENDCEVTINTIGDIQQTAENGVCEDAIYISTLLGIEPVLTLFNTSTINVTFASPGPELIYKLYTTSVFEGIDTIQFVSDEAFLMNISTQQFYYDQSVVMGIPAVTNEDTPITILIYFLNSTTLEILQPVSQFEPFSISYYLNDTFLIETQQWFTDYGGLVQANRACCAGCDCADCGSSARLTPIQTAVQCTYSPAQGRLLEMIANSTVVVNQTYYVANLTALTNWTGIYHNVRVTRNQPVLGLQNCPGQVCNVTHPWRCDNGECVAYYSDCNDRFFCPANGCVQQTDAATQGFISYRCACDVGFGGDACQYSVTSPATPRLQITQQGVIPGALESKCGGPPALRQKPPIINEDLGFLTEAALNQMNWKWTADSPQQCENELGYLRVMPSSGWGQALRYQFFLRTAPLDVLSEDNQIIYTTCPPMRMGFHGEYVLLTDDLLSVDPTTCQPTWKTWTNSNGAEQQFPWSSMTTYNDFPYRCANGQCVPNQSFCQQSEALFPLCNNRGECRADDTCDCYPGWRTIIVNERITESAKFPYFSSLGIPNPTVWELNDNWRRYGLNWCVARDCSNNGCAPPIACFPGTPGKDFADRLVQCAPTTGRGNRCAPSQGDCAAGINIQYPITCGGNGIPKIKDFTGEYYCHCGKPISPLANITQITQITDLQKNGWGGPACDQYNAPPAPLVYSTWNFLLDQPFRSAITNDSLPGMWIQGVSPVGPDPDQRLEWQTCCQGYSRLEMCPFTVCLVQKQLQCVLSQDCLSPNTPQVFPCNNHGTARADGTCECDSTVGSGYTNDYTQFSIDGCYREFTCPVSEISGTACNFVEACSDPSEWRYPAPEEVYLKQQAWMCGPRQGLISNATLLNQINVAQDLFSEQLLDALAVIAISVQDEITALQGCVCVYPNDTTNDKYGMISGQSLQYKQSYVYSYLLGGAFDGFPYLTNYNRLFSLGEESYIIQSGESLQFTLSLNQTTYLSAIRIFGNTSTTPSPTMPLTFRITSSTGTTICDQAVVVTPLFPGQLEWMVGETSASYCTPRYECETFANNVNYDSFCSNPTSLACQNWRQGLCLASPATLVYWPLSSQSQYDGCQRGTNEPLCTCCRQLETPFPSITNGLINITFQGPGEAMIGTIELYGNTEEALEVSPLLEEMIQNISGISNTDCVDYLFLSSVLGGKTDYHLANQEQWLTFNQSQDRCRLADSYLAVPMSSRSDESSNAFQRQCNLLNADITSGTIRDCWAGARDTKLYDDYATRAQILDADSDDYCTACYLPIQTVIIEASSFAVAAPQTRIVNQFSFSTYPLTPSNSVSYKQAMQPNQESTMDILGDIFFRGGFRGYGVYTDTQKDYYTPDDGSSVIDNCNIDFEYPGPTPWSVLGSSVFVRIVFTRASFPYSSSATIRQNLPLEGLRTVSIFTTTPYTYGEVISSAIIRSRSASGLGSDYIFNEWLNYINGRTPSNIASIPRYCATISFYDKATCSNSEFVASPTNTNGQVGSLPFYIISAQCQTIYANPAAGSIMFTTVTSGVPPCTTPDPIGNPFTNLKTGSLHCYRIFPTYNFFKVELLASKTRRLTKGAFGGDFAPGVDDYPFMPAFMSIKIERAIGWAIGSTYRQGEFILQDNVPIYFTSNPSLGYTTLMSTYSLFPIPDCRSCINPLRGNFLWLTQIYSERGLPWPINIDEPPAVEIYVKRTVGGTEFIKLELSTAFTTPTFAHLVTYIESRAKQLASPSRVASQQWQWYLSSCLAVNSTSFVTRPCEYLANYICQYDYLKTAVVGGYQCDECGDSTRRASIPTPGLTCFDGHQLANSTAFPEQHLIYQNYLANTLDIYAESISPPAETDLINNKSIIWAIPDNYQKWVLQDSTRGPESGGKTSVGVKAEQDWCDLSVKANWPNDCEKLGFSIRDPITNDISRTCTADPTYCVLTVPTGENPPLNARFIPPLYGPVDPTLSQTDPTCGYPVFLASYFEMDRWGAGQSDLLINNTLIQSSSTFVKVMIVTPPSLIFNGGKTPTQYRFEWNRTATISGQVNLLSCPSCVFPITLTVMIHPIDPSYAEPTTYLTQAVSITSLGLTTYQVTFSVTSYDTGVTYRDGQAFPTRPFRGVAFLLDIPTTSSFYLFNPIITDATTTALCEGRELPTGLVEPRPRIDSTAPYRQCIANAETQQFYPGSDLGDCGCDISTAGRACDCPATTSKYGKEVCGGFGDPVAAVKGPSGQLQLTGEGTEEGCYVVGKKSYCKAIDVGTAVWTLMVPSAVWNYPSIYIDAAPAQGSSLFFETTPPPLPTAFEDSRALCAAEAAYLPFFFTSDELTQLVRTSLFPVLMSIDHTTDPASWPWLSNIDGSYFTRDEAGTTVATAVGDFDCSGLAIDVCDSINFNNLAYDSPAGGCLTDGNTVTVCGASGSTNITYASTSVLEVTVTAIPSANAVVCVDGVSACDVVTAGEEWLCRCASRVMDIDTSSGLTAEIKIFASTDEVRVSVY
jgi:hypothetical protein